MNTRAILSLITALALIIPLLPTLNQAWVTELQPGVFAYASLIPRPYTLSVVVRGGELVLDGESLYGYVYVHFGNSTCSYPLKQVIGRGVSCNLRDGVKFWSEVLTMLGVGGRKAEDVLKALKSRGAGAVALPTITIRFSLYDGSGDEYVAVFTITPVDYYLAHVGKLDEAVMKTLERPLEFVERGLAIIIERDYLVSRLARMPRLVEILSIMPNLEVTSTWLPGTPMSALNTTPRGSGVQATYTSSLSGCEFIGWIPIYNGSHPDEWLTSKIYVNVRRSDLSRDHIYELLWESYLYLFGRFIRCPGSWSREMVLNHLQYMYSAYLGIASPLNDIVSPENILLALINYNAYLEYYVSQGWVTISWNHTCLLPPHMCTPGVRYSWTFTAHKPYMIFFHQDTNEYPAHLVSLEAVLSRIRVNIAYRRSGIAVAGILIVGQNVQNFNISWAAVLIDSNHISENISAVALLVPTVYRFEGDAFYLKVDMWQSSGYWYATVTPIPFPFYREIEEKSYELWRVIYYDNYWRPVGCYTWNGTPASNCPREDALSVLNSVMAFTNVTFHTVYSSNYNNVPRHLLVVDTSINTSLSHSENLASVAFSVLLNIGLAFASGRVPSRIAPVLNLISLISYVDTTFSGTGVRYDMGIRRLGGTTGSNPSVIIEKLTFGYAHGPAKPLLGAYFVYVGYVPGGYEDCGDIACPVNLRPFNGGRGGAR